MSSFGISFTSNRLRPSPSCTSRVGCIVCFLPNFTVLRVYARRCLLVHRTRRTVTLHPNRAFALSLSKLFLARVLRPSWRETKTGVDNDLQTFNSTRFVKDSIFSILTLSYRVLAVNPFFQFISPCLLNTL